MKPTRRQLLILAVPVALLGSLASCGGGGGGNNNPPPPAAYTLTVSKTGTGSGTVSSSPTGISCGSSCSASYNSGTSVTLTAAPATGSLFTGWSGDCSGTGTTCTLSMTRNRSVGAKFDLVVVSVTPATASVTVGGTQQFLAKDQLGNVLDVNWYVNDVQSGNATVGTIDISGLYTAPATVPNPATVTVKACNRDNSAECGTAAVTIAPLPEKIAFIYQGTSRMDNIWTMNPDGTELLQLTWATWGSHQEYLFPAFSPDGTQIAFHSNRDGPIAIYTMKLDGSNQSRINTGFGYSTWPNWSPDGQKVAFIYMDDVEQQAGVAVIELETGTVTKLTIEGCCAISTHPSWSPDGTKIAFDSPRTGDWDIYVMNADGTGVTNISNARGTNELQASWSPDGTLIAFMSNAVGHWEIYVMNTDGTSVRKVTDTPAGHEQAGALDPAWSPDGKRLVFAKSDDYLYTVAVDGSEAEQPLPNSPAPARFPAWAQQK